MSRFPESRYDYKRRMTTRFALAVCGAALLAFVAIAVASSGAKAQNNFVTPGGSDVDGKVMMCLNAQGQAVPVDQAGACPTGSGGGGGAATIADGADVTQGAKADAACGTDTGTCTQMALIKRQLQTLTSILAGVVGSIPTQLPTVSIGGVGIIDSGGINKLVLDPCESQAQTPLPISITTGTTTNILTGTAAKKIYVCYLYLQTAAANNVAVIEGTTGATCGALTKALVGGVTAANGLNNAANSGQAFVNGGKAALQTTVNNNDICIITSAATPLAGIMRYVVQ